MSEKGFRIEIPVHIKRDRRARKVVRQGSTPEPAPDAVPRIARLLALAHKWEGMVRRGVVQDYAELARLTGLTRGRVAQICSLTLLAPNLQEEILDADRPRGPNSTHALRRIDRSPQWRDQHDKRQQGLGSSVDAHG